MVDFKQVTPSISRDTLQAADTKGNPMPVATALRSLEDCIKHHNLFLIHIGHAWFMVRVTGDDSAPDGAIPLPQLNRMLPKSAMINSIARIGDVAMLEKWLTAGKFNKASFIERMNVPLAASGYENVVGRRV